MPDSGCRTPTLHPAGPWSLQLESGAALPQPPAACQTCVTFKAGSLLQAPQLSPRTLCDPGAAAGPL